MANSDQATSRTVLLVDDEPDILELLELALRKMGLEVGRSQNYKEADDFMFYPEVYQAY